MNGWLEQGIKRAFAQILDVQITDEMAVRFAMSVARSRPEQPSSNMDGIIASVAEETGIPESVMLGQSRAWPAVRARYAAIAKCWDEGFSQPQIGKRMNRDPSSICEALRRVAEKPNRRALHDTDK